MKIPINPKDLTHLANLFSPLLRPREHIYCLREEIPIADELLELAPKICEEFLLRNPDFFSPERFSNPEIKPVYDGEIIGSHKYAWHNDLLYMNGYGVHGNKKIWNDDKRESYPTAFGILEKYQDVCQHCTYSILDRNSVIERHTGYENRDNLFLRIHVPLLIPPGDIFFETEGVEIDWSDIFGFDNQLVHSAHNPTDNRRLVLLIDISREFLGIPIPPPWSNSREQYMMKNHPFIRGVLPKVLHKHQR